MNTREADRHIVQAYPTKDLFISILVRDISVRDAIGDLLDNSVDGALRLRPTGDYDGLWVNIELDAKNDRFVIEDNCGGISVAVARNYAFRFGRPAESENTEYSVGVFGIGMKRALFRLGKKFVITSAAKDSSFEIEVDVDKWESDSDPNWHFEFRECKENLTEEISEASRGTKIVVTDLLPDVTSTFELGLEIADLIAELQREHLCNLDQGLSITVNEQPLKAPDLKLLMSDMGDFKTAYWEGSENSVQVRIYAGIAEQEKYGPSGGWYIFCNRRLVLGPDTTRVTGWGIDSPVRIPEYHPQYYRFRGYVFLDAKDPRKLPWNTTKTSVDLDSTIYRRVFQRMIILMRSVTDFLNQLHREVQDYNKEKIDETPSQDILKQAQIVPLSVVMENAATCLSFEKFAAPEPAKPARPIPEQVTIRYMVAKSIYDPVRRYFDADKPGDVGRETFSYFYEREIGE